MGNGNSKSTLDASEILLIGSPSTVLAEAQTAGRHFDYAGNALPIQTYPSIAEALDSAGKRHFAVITVVMGSAVKIRSGLAALRKNTSAKILLLARMCEEPTARELVNGGGLADDYVICPIRLEKLCEAINPRREGVLETTVTRERIGRLEKLATEDDLTGLKNRRYILEFARQIIERAKKDNGRVTVLIFDIDNFKHYNDEYGHAAGDEVLKQAAVLIRRCCRTHDAVARLGGDEFAAVFWDDPKCPLFEAGQERRRSAGEHPREVILIAKRFRKELGKADLRLLGAEGKGVLTISGGLAGLGIDGTTPEELFTKADEALLDAKRSGKNRVYLVGKSENDIDKIE